MSTQFRKPKSLARSIIEALRFVEAYPPTKGDVHSAFRSEASNLREYSSLRDTSFSRKPRPKKV